MVYIGDVISPCNLGQFVCIDTSCPNICGWQIVDTLSKPLVENWKAYYDLVQLIEIMRNYQNACCSSWLNSEIFEILSYFNWFHSVQNGLHFADDIFIYIFMNEKLCISIQFLLKFIPEGLIDNMSALVKVMAWHRTGDKPLPEPRLTWFTDGYMRPLGGDELTHGGRVTHICISKLTIVVSDNGLSPGRRQAIIWTNAGILLIGPLGTNFSEILIKI